MTTKEAIHAMIDGKKVYRKSWKNDYVDYFYFDGECFRDEQDVLLMCDFHGDDWEIYEEPKQKQIVVIERWLCLFDGTIFSVLDIEKSQLSVFCAKFNYKTLKLIDTYEVEL